MVASCMRPPEEVRRTLLRQWLQRAEEDYRVAAHLLESNDFFFNAVGFHAHQAAEKYLKALLTEHQIEFPKTHDIEALLDLAGRIDSACADRLRISAVLTVYGVQIRYPGDAPVLTGDDARTALQLAGTVREEIRSLLLGRGWLEPRNNKQG